MQWRKPYKTHGVWISRKFGSLESDVDIEILRQTGTGQTKTPLPIIKQLKEGGRLIVPLGSTVYFQTLTLATKRKGELEVEQLSPVAFVPMVGERINARSTNRYPMPSSAK